MTDIRRSQEARLASIDFHLMHLGKVTRREHMARFDISAASASGDISLYMDFMAPGQVTYDTRDQVYVAGETFKPVYKQPSTMTLQILGNYHTPEELVELHKFLTARIGIPIYQVQDAEQ